MLIASAAMFFAIAGSAFILRARMAGSGCPRSHGAPPEQTKVTIEAPSEKSQGSRPAGCGRAVYRKGADGTTSVTYDLCPAERRSAKEEAPRTVYELGEHVRFTVR